MHSIPIGAREKDTEVLEPTRHPLPDAGRDRGRGAGSQELVRLDPRTRKPRRSSRLVSAAEDPENYAAVKFLHR